MNMLEYDQVKTLNYIEYCDYLQEKYGIGHADYMTKSFNKNAKVSRTSEGLFAHHKYEDHAIDLSEKNYAQKNPFEWQLAKNIVYCDYLEHLFLHILICENPSKDKNPYDAVGIGGITNFIVPHLNDAYSGWRSNAKWEQSCLNKVIEDKDVYFALIKRIKKSCKGYPCYTETSLYSSFNEKYGLWSKTKNKKIFEEIKSL